MLNDVRFGVEIVKNNNKLHENVNLLMPLKSQNGETSFQNFDVNDPLSDNKSSICKIF